MTVSKTTTQDLNSSGRWKLCAVCGDQTSRPFRAALSHFRLVSPYFREHLRYFKGNMRTFGAWSGFSATLGLLFPIYNTLINWRYRKMRLTIEGTEEVL